MPKGSLKRLRYGNGKSGYGGDTPCSVSGCINAWGSLKGISRWVFSGCLCPISAISFGGELLLRHWLYSFAKISGCLKECITNTPARSHFLTHAPCLLYNIALFLRQPESVFMKSPFSLLLASLSQRLAIAAAVLLMVWGVYFWAVAA